jgi:large subunit ribosomal protein L10
MSKPIKQMEMDALKKSFQGIQDLVFLSSSGLSCQTDNQLRLALRKKNIHLQVVKNSLARRVFNDLGFKLEKYWEGPTTVAWGAGSVAELSRELETFIKKNDKMKVKGVLAEGQEISFDRALKMPTRVEAIGKVIALALSPAQRLMAQVIAPAATIAGQLKTLTERPAESSPAESSSAPAESNPAPAESSPAPAQAG